MRRSPGWFNPRNSGVWWNCRRSAVSIIDTSGERHSHSLLFGRSLTLHLAVASLQNPSFRREDHISGLRSRDRAQKDIKREKFHHREVLANHRVVDSVVAKVTGHRSATLKRYQHLSESFRKQTVDLIASVLMVPTGDTRTDTPANCEPESVSRKGCKPKKSKGLDGRPERTRTVDLYRLKMRFLV
jgi:hypothetical protein